MDIKNEMASSRWIRLLVYLTLLWGALSIGGMLAPFAQSMGETSIAPVSPDFVKVMQDRESERVMLLSAEGFGLGLLPSPIDLSHLEGQSVSQEPRLLGFPVSYDLRSQGKLTPVRNQGSCGSCWSFATYGSLESNLLPYESWDFSEDNLIHFHGYDIDPCDGGNADMAAAYLARWDGPVSEADDPYNFFSPPGLIEGKHLQGMFILPNRTGSLDNDSIKQALMAYGAIYTSMYWGSAYYHSGNRAFYYSGTNTANHAVAIVGWDDNFDRNKFLTPPPGNGAFIIRNSWGTGWGEGGYFYISYYDSKIGRNNAILHLAEPTSNYSHIYQYDPLGWVGNLGYGSNTAWFANIFPAVSNDPISAVSFYTSSLNSSYEVHVYTQASSGPTSGSLAGSKTGTISLPGYHTIVLNASASVTAGQRFSVVVKLTTPGYLYPIPMERPYTGYSSQATANPGESYISSNGTNWTDLTSYYSNSNVCLKAFSEAPPVSHQAIVDLIMNYYNDILERSPDQAGLDFWVSEIERTIGLGIDIKEGFISLAKSFFNSAEYLSRGKTDAAYVTDLYETFLQRIPSQSEIDYWVGYLTTGMSRNIALNYFVYSPEFKLYMEGLFGEGATRPENNLVNDFYRGFLNRLPDSGGFLGYLGLMRTAQCTGAQAVRDLSHQIALGFIESAEYVLRGRTDSQFVEDLYDGILRRGALPSEVSYWVTFLGTGKRAEALQYFTDSPEFQIRVQEVIQSGCFQ